MEVNSPKKMKAWSEAIKKEDRIRMCWFNKNEVKLIELSEKENVHHANADDLINLRENTKVLYGPGRQKNPKRKSDITGEGNIELPEQFQEIEDVPMHIMKPVDPVVRKLLYNDTHKFGRQEYLHARAKLIPELRYYFPETTSFLYGWNMWECAKEIGGSKFGRSLIVRKSFYRRRAGVENDPQWYSIPNMLSPTICTYSG